MLNIKVKKFSENAVIPKKMTDGSVGFDLSVTFKSIENYKFIGTTIDENNNQYRYTMVSPNEKIMFDTEIGFSIPKGHFMSIHPRSSVGIKKNLILSNCTGIIDSDYRDSVKISVRNIGDTSIEVREFERLVQCIILPYPTIQFEEVEELEETERGLNGIGSTGIL